MKKHIPAMQAEPASEAEFERYVQSARDEPGLATRLLPLLREQHPVYADKSANTVSRMRAFVLYSFVFTGLPEQALPFLYEELESGREAYLVAAAAIALRSAERKRTEMAALLTAALVNIRHIDQPVSFEAYAPVWPPGQFTTAHIEIFKSLSWLGAYAKDSLPELRRLAAGNGTAYSEKVSAALSGAILDIENDQTTAASCCDDRPDTGRQYHRRGRGRVKKLAQQALLEDHNGERLSLRELTSDGYTLVCFFYTRCDNPLKCSLTITNLAQIQSLARSSTLATSLKLAAFSYDPDYDSPTRLKNFGEARSLQLDGTAALFRVTRDYEAVREYFDLGVNYTGGVVNRHVIELYLVDKFGDVRLSFEREKVDPSAIVKAIEAQLEADRKPVKRIAGVIRQGFGFLNTTVFPVLILLLPKCPLCFAAYCSMAGIAGSQLLPFVPYFFPALMLVIGINLVVLYLAAKRRNGYLPFLLCLAGAALVVVFGYWFLVKVLALAGVVLLVSGSMINALPFRVFLKLKGLLALH
jgi:protein SCO1/2